MEKNSLKHSTLQERPLRAMCNPKYIRYGLLGQAWKPVVVYLVVHIICMIFYANLGDCESYHDTVGKTVTKKKFWSLDFVVQVKQSGL